MDNDDNASECRGCGMETGFDRERALAGVEYAGFWKRAAAALIDTAVLFMAGMGIGAAYLAVNGSKEGFDLANNVLGVVIGWLYYAGFESSRKQATPGKAALGLVVTDLNGRRISFYRATSRHFGKIVSSIILGIGFIMAGYTEKKQALHDKMFDCLVIVKK
jgi:uncharacterized RDD family membrane protein YckC